MAGFWQANGFLHGVSNLDRTMANMWQSLSPPVDGLLNKKPPGIPRAFVRSMCGVLIRPLAVSASLPLGDGIFY
jgi:hypothetical protein